MDKDIREVKNLMNKICEKCAHYNGRYCMSHPEYGEVCDRDKCDDYVEECEQHDLTDKEIDEQGDMDDDFNERSKGLERLGPMTNWG